MFGGSGEGAREGWGEWANEMMAAVTRWMSMGPRLGCGVRVYESDDMVCGVMHCNGDRLCI